MPKKEYFIKDCSVGATRKLSTKKLDTSRNVKKDAFSLDVLRECLLKKILNKTIIARAKKELFLLKTNKVGPINRMGTENYKLADYFNKCEKLT